MRTNRVTLLAAVILLIALAGGWYWGSPLYAMHALSDAAQSGDKEELKKAIDFRSVRESLKSQVSAQLAQQLTKAKEKGGFEAFGAIMAMGMMGPMIDGVITPEFLANTIKHGTMGRPSLAAASKSQGKAADWIIARDGLDHFRATPKARPGEKVPTMVFDRHGLGWKLAGIEIPEGTMSGRQEPSLMSRS